MDSNTLEETLKSIKLDKDTNLLPENLKKGITVLGVDGTLESGSSNIKLFDTVEDMNNDTSCEEGTIGVVLKTTTAPFTEQTNFQYLYLPNKIEVPKSGYDELSITVDDGNSSYMSCIIQPQYGSAYSIYMGGSETQYTYDWYDIDNSGDTIIGTRKSGCNSIISVPCGTNWKPSTVLSTETLYGIKGLNIEFVGIYIFDGSVWTYQPIGTTAYPLTVVSGKTFYTDSGMKTGTLHTEYYKQMTIDDNTTYDTFKEIVKTQATMRHINLNITKTSFDDTWQPLELRDIYNGDMMTSCGNLDVYVGKDVVLPSTGLFTCSSSIQYSFNTINLSGYDITKVLMGSSMIEAQYYNVTTYTSGIVLQPIYTYKYNIFDLMYSCELEAGNANGMTIDMKKTELLMLIEQAYSHTGVNNRGTQTLTLPSDWYSLCTADEWKVLTDKNWTITQK